MTADMETFSLCSSGRTASRLGMGCWAIGGHGWGTVSDDESIAAVHRALDRGVTLFDTADVYGLGHSESILSRALDARRHDVVISSKFGVRVDDRGKTFKDISPRHMWAALEGSLRRLRVDTIPLYFVHWPDGQTPISEIIGELAKARSQGKIAAIGLSNFSSAQLAEALEVTFIDAVQVKMNLFERESADDLIPLCRQHGVALTTWGSLADGLLTGKFDSATRFPTTDHRSRHPEFVGERFEQNLRRVAALRCIAEQRKVTTAQLALRWLLDTHGVDCVLFGAKRPSQVDENLGTLHWKLSREEYETVESIGKSCVSAC